jgi:hypothetical protein
MPFPVKFISKNSRDNKSHVQHLKKKNFSTFSVDKSLTFCSIVAGWPDDIFYEQMSLWQNRPKCRPTNFCQNYYIIYTEEKNGATFVIFIKLPKVNDRPLGENSPNLVILGGYFTSLACSEADWLSDDWLAFLFSSNGINRFYSAREKWTKNVFQIVHH